MKGKLFLGRYEVQRQLGEGGMGIVYLARQLDLQRYVVVKVMHEHLAAEPKFRERFQREMLLTARFQHPYAVTLYDASLNDPAGPCLIMEYIRGVTLEELLEKNHRLSPARVGRLLGQVCEVLQAAHNQGFIHRDLKPANIMVVDADTPYEKVKVMDFGLAKLVDKKSIGKSASSSPDVAIGTPAYMSPEEVRGEDVGYKTDLYSLGVIVYELLTGKLPFDRPSAMDTMLAQATEPPPAMSVDDVWIPPAIERVVQKSLQKKPDSRPESARELARLYEEALLGRDDRPASEPVQEPLVQETHEPPPAVMLPDDPTAVVFQIQAWMPEKVASYKLKGFIQDIGGKVIENVPGCIKVHLGGKGSAYKVPKGSLSWLGFGSGHSIELELQLQHNSDGRQNHLAVTAIFRFLGRTLVSNWREICNQIFCDLRGYLVGSGAGS